MGVPWNSEVNDGSMVGYTIFPSSVDQQLNVREDASRAYYFPFRDQPNLEVLLNTRVNRIVWKPSNDQNESTADGVEIHDNTGNTQVVKAKKEVILAAGALVSPLHLEMSGVGNPDILSKYDIDTVVDLPTVGENLQDQMNNGLGYLANKNYTLTGQPAYVAYPSASQIFGDETDKIAAQLKSSLASYASQVARVNNHVTSEEDLLRFFELQYDLIFESQVAIAELLMFQVEGAWSTEYWALLPFARGSVHITSANTTENAAINPNYFMLDWDMQEQIYAAGFIRQLYSTQPFSKLVGDETKPGLDTVPLSADDETWAEWLKDTYRSNFHPVATAAMMPREIGGVVDTNLKVYGTANVRVVDASVLPFQVCGHLVSTIYAVAERASDLIKGDW
ncbi:related to alcohol oxidase [Cephalotrichum gorgonifer]|uniref:Related to alcohol oxidase n=1 Tax=Cephalotrichum gorgonifer TaxID=2041049 RepID=A0AAE8MYH5_9PEZI|nr:related to alcohol oxidase [Cephalotrichum gorgonifer]